MTQGHVQGSTVLLNPPVESTLTSKTKNSGIIVVFGFLKTFTFGLSSKRNHREAFH